MRRCPECGSRAYTEGPIETSAVGHKGREFQRAVYFCKNEECEKFESVIEPI